MILRKLLMSTALIGVAGMASAEIKVGFIGSLSSDTGLSTLRGAQMAIEEMNANGGVMGQQITLVTADTQEDVTEGVKAYEYLAETEEVDFIVSGSIDDVSLGYRGCKNIRSPRWIRGPVTSASLIWLQKIQKGWHHIS